MFPSPCGVWVVSGKVKGRLTKGSFPSPCGVWVVSWSKYREKYSKQFPSPCGVWVVSATTHTRDAPMRSFRPLAGCGLFRLHRGNEQRNLWFPSPCGVWVVSIQNTLEVVGRGFRPLAGCGLFLVLSAKHGHCKRFRPLAGCGLFRAAKCLLRWGARFPSPCGVWVVSREVRRGDRRGKVSVPLRGVGCFQYAEGHTYEEPGFRPLAGCGLFHTGGK